METNFEPNTSHFDEGMSNVFGIKPKAERKANRAARKAKKSAKKDAKKGISTPVEKPSVTVAPKEEAPKEPVTTPDITTEEKKSDDNTTDSNKIMGLNKYVFYVGGAVVLGAIIFGGYKLIMGKGTSVVS